MESEALRGACSIFCLGSNYADRLTYACLGPLSRRCEPCIPGLPTFNRLLYGASQVNISLIIHAYPSFSHGIDQHAQRREECSAFPFTVDGFPPMTIVREASETSSPSFRF
jgi:hypothetical protein